MGGVSHSTYDVRYEVYERARHFECDRVALHFGCFDSAFKNTNMPQNKFLQHRLVMTATILQTRVLSGPTQKRLFWQAVKKPFLAVLARF